MERTFSFVDLAGFSALTEAHGDETGADLVERFATIAASVLEDDGEIVSTIGDAIFLVSPEPKSALQVLSRLWARLESERDFPALRAGVHHGEAARRGRQFYGTAVNIAARVTAQAGAGEVLVTAPVAPAARAAGMTLRALGAMRLKNLRDAVELFEVKMAPPRERERELFDPVCRMRVTPETARAHLELDGVQHWFCSRDCLRIFVSEGR